MEDFVYVNSWFEQAYREKLDSRYFTFKVALNLFLQFQGKNIVETGCMRLKDDWGAGMSTFIFGAFCKKYNKHLWTVDINPKNLLVAQQETQEYKDYISYHYNDSLAFLQAFDRTIDLLYLDSLDFPLDSMLDPSTCQRHTLQELQLAFPKLSARPVVLIDDNNFPRGGKTILAKQWLKDLGWICLLDFQQTLWIPR